LDEVAFPFDEVAFAHALLGCSFRTGPERPGR
jgi:hypothetical protein